MFGEQDPTARGSANPMVKRTFITLIACFAIGCSIPIPTTQTPKKKPCAMYWMEHKDPDFRDNYLYVCPDTGEAIGSINRGRENLWKAWVKGAGYGDFLDKVNAQNQVEKVVALRDLP